MVKEELLVIEEKYMEEAMKMVSAGVPVKDIVTFFTSPVEDMKIEENRPESVRKYRENLFREASKLLQEIRSYRVLFEAKRKARK